MNPSSVEHLVRSLYRLGLVQRELSRHALEELGSQGFLALAVIRRQGPIRISDIAETLSVTLSVASRQVASLESAGYAERQADPEDGRAYRVTATATGRQVLRESHRRMVHAFSEALEDWTGSELEALSGALERLRDDVQQTVARRSGKGAAA